MEKGRRYRIHGILGRGGFGTVYRADLLGESGFTRQVALKVLNPDMKDVRTVAARLRDEARLLGMLNHRAIVKVDGLVRLNDRWTVVMEYVEGADLARLLVDGPIPVSVAVEILGEVAAALHVAFSQPGPDGQPLKLLHRDIKPPNVIITPHGEVKVLDFGVARAEFAGREAKTQAMLIGSLGYMAPERYEHRDEHASDVFSLGVLLYELVTGGVFGRSSVHPERYAKRRDEAIEELRQVPTMTGEVADFIEKMLAYEPEDRPVAREVERVTRDLRRSVEGDWLRDWAEEFVPAIAAEADMLEVHDFPSDIISEIRSDAHLKGVDGGWPDQTPPPADRVSKHVAPTFLPGGTPIPAMDQTFSGKAPVKRSTNTMDVVDFDVIREDLEGAGELPSALPAQETAEVPGVNGPTALKVFVQTFTLLGVPAVLVALTFFILVMFNCCAPMFVN